MSTPPRRAVTAADPLPTPPGERLPDRVAAGVRRRARRSLDTARAAADARWGRPRDDSRPIYLVAPAGHPNHGDEQLLAGWLRYLRHHRPGTPVVVDCHTPGQAAVLHHAAHPDVLFTDTLWRLAGEFAGPDSASEAIEFCRAAVADLGVRPALASGVDLVRRASMIHLIGGGYINDQWPHHLGVAAGAGEAGRLAGARVVATGQGFAPCADAAVLADALSGFDLVTVRDAASRDLLAGAGVNAHLIGDDGWLALSGAVELDAAEHPVYSDDPADARDLMICAQSDLVDPQLLADGLARILADWRVPGERITVVESIPGGDRVVWDLVCARAAGAAGAARAAGEGGAGAGSGDHNDNDHNDNDDNDNDDKVGRTLAELELGQARFVPFQHVWAAGLPARDHQVWLTSRFHPHLFAAARGASGLALRTGSSYYDVKHGSLAAAGSPWATVDVRDVVVDSPIPPLPTAGGFATPAVSALVGAAEALAAELYPR